MNVVIKIVMKVIKKIVIINIIEKDFNNKYIKIVLQFVI